MYGLRAKHRNKHWNDLLNQIKLCTTGVFQYFGPIPRWKKHNSILEHIIGDLINCAYFIKVNAQSTFSIQYLI